MKVILQVALATFMGVNWTASGSAFAAFSFGFCAAFALDAILDEITRRMT